MTKQIKSKLDTKIILDLCYVLHDKQIFSYFKIFRNGNRILFHMQEKYENDYDVLKAIIRNKNGSITNSVGCQNKARKKNRRKN